MPTLSVTHTLRRAAEDPRQSLTFIESEFPAWPISLHYLLVEADNGATDWFNVGLEVGKALVPATGEERSKLEGIWRRRIDPAVLQHVAANYIAYERRAREYLEGQRDLRKSAPPLKQERRRRRRDMTPAKLQLLAEQYVEYQQSERSPVKELARDYGVNTSTISRWVAKARDAGYLGPKGASDAG